MSLDVIRLVLLHEVHLHLLRLHLLVVGVAAGRPVRVDGGVRPHVDDGGDALAEAIHQGAGGGGQVVDGVAWKLQCEERFE